MSVAKPALDPDVIRELRQLTASGDPDVLREVLLIFREAVPVRLAAIRSACEVRDAGALHRAAHDLKGAAAAIGAHRLQQCCRELELAGKGGGFRTTADLLAALDLEAVVVEDAIAQLVGYHQDMLTQRYPEPFIAPMREELTRVGFEELRSAQAVDAAVARKGTTLVVVNSVCGCAAGKARPGIALSLRSGPRPEHLTTVFAGGDIEATERARAHMAPYPPSSPSVALFKDGRLVFMMERRDIESQPATAIAERLQAAYQQHCS